MGGDPSWRNQNLYCTYHKDKGYTTEKCRVLKDHLEQLVKAGYLKEFVMDSGNQGTGQGAQQRGDPLPPPIESDWSHPRCPEGYRCDQEKRSVDCSTLEDWSGKQPSEKKLKFAREPIAFNDDDLKGTTQPHDDALVVMARINGFIIKRAMVDQGSGVDVMYPDLFKGLGPKNEDLSKYDTPMVGFDSRVVIPQRKISLPVNMEGKEVVVAFIVVAWFSPYTAILGRPWIHAIVAVPSTLHVKAKFCTKQGIAVVRGSQ
ncbi:uncharacterized protein LOC115961279 [Quercus lobata]|uniref:uncharacterized protein LOC115961279 n=1 Tax=Quercus lobata TaxID=97700 RepID=UPI00124839E0|nr:uncharacterized protein LOC115961279 [Quercus lobata]